MRVCFLLIALVCGAPSWVAAPDSPADSVTSVTVTSVTVTSVTPEARDAAIQKAMRYVNDHLWRLTDHGSPRKQYAAAVAAWAYLLAASLALAAALICLTLKFAAVPQRQSLTSD